MTYRAACFVGVCGALALSGCAHDQPLRQDPKLGAEMAAQVAASNLLSHHTSRDTASSVYSETTGAVVRIPLGPGTPLGQGFTSVGNNIRGLALKKTSSSASPVTESGVVYNFEYIRNYEDLAKSLNVSLSASYSGLGGGASAKVNLFRSAKLSSTKAYALVSMTVLTHTETLKELEFDEAALRRASKADLSEFLSTYGDTFIFRLLKGAELHAILEFDMSRKELQERLRASAKAGFGGFSAKGSVDESLKRLTENVQVKVRYAQSGGGTGRPAHPPALAASEPNKEEVDNSGTVTGVEKRNVATTGGVLLLNINDFLGRVRDFAQEARDLSANSAVLTGEAMDYNVVRNKPPGFVIHPKLTAARTLEDLATVRSKLAEELEANIEVLEFPERYKGVTSAEVLARVDFMSFAEKYVGRLGEELVAYPRLADQGRDKLLLPRIDKYRADTASSGCEMPQNGDVEVAMLCMFAKVGSDWRLSPQLAAVRIARTSSIPLNGNGAPVIDYRIKLKNQGEWITGEPPKKLYGFIRDTGDQIERFAAVGGRIEGDEGVLTIRMNVPGWRYQGGRVSWPILWIACPDDCDIEQLMMIDVPRESGRALISVLQESRGTTAAASPSIEGAAQASDLVKK